MKALNLDKPSRTLGIAALNASHRLAYSSALCCAMLARDSINLLKYGKDAPRFAEKLYVDPRLIRYSIRAGGQLETSAKVVNECDIFKHALRTVDDFIISSCLAHWQDGMTWRQTGLIRNLSLMIRRHGSWDGCRSAKDIRHRYQMLDALFAEAKSSGRLKDRRDINPANLREAGGILCCIGPGGELFFGGNGNHRLAIAICLSMPTIPVQLGAIHISALNILKCLRAPTG